MAGSTQELFDDEFTREVRDAYVTLRVQGVPGDEATEAVIYGHRYSALMSPAHAALLWLALAVTQWQYGELLDLVRSRAAAAIADDAWIASWAVAPTALAWRRQIVAAVGRDLASPSPAAPPFEIEPSCRAEPLDTRQRQKLAASLASFKVAARGINVDAPAETVVHEIARRLDDAVTASPPLTEAQRTAAIVQLGTIWGAQLARFAEWEWAVVIDAGGFRTRSLVRRDRSACLSPFLHISWHLDDPEATKNVAVALFQAARDGAIPRAREPGALLSLRDFAYRLSDRKWPEQRAQLLRGEAHPDCGPTPTPPGVDTLESYHRLSDTSCCAASAPVPVVSAEIDTSSPPQPAEVARRALVLRSVLDHTVAALPRDLLARYAAGWDPAERARYAPEAQALSRRRVDALRANGLWTHAEREEQTVLETPFTDLDIPRLLATSWRAESLAVLLWALGRLDVLPPYDESVNGEVLLGLTARDGGDGFVLGATLRPIEEIERARTIAELWHWRSRTRQWHEERRRFPGIPGFPVKCWDDVVRFTAPQAVEQGLLSHAVDDDFPAFGRAYRDLSAEEWSRARSIARERHFALNWLCGYAPGNRWSETPTAT